MNKYSTAIIGLLSLFTLMMQAFLFLGTIMTIWMFGSSSTNRKDAIAMILDNIDLTNSSLTPNFYAAFYLGILFFTSLTLFLYLNCIRHLLQNINEKIYFEEKNLKMIKRTLIFFSLYTLVNFGLELIHRAFNVTYLYDASAYPAYSWVGVFDGLITVMGIYVLYVVFRQGVLLKQENQSIV
ncbi:DUF2975 domain-containing protein [Enterococcus sp. 669A]|uniref:DUF2975 domain-containing protein n=1 Tax=Candidatus Enterococcus moelleringii TaxID=2815325 RepID=A0ABS3LAK2_9ENTE|nr:DUF2975 domain-containing protein [Enterococcus sp. 669A]MBO1306665.1 DUF2975 domain-containing protein [Enterococcus sp. 669A]